MRVIVTPRPFRVAWDEGYCNPYPGVNLTEVKTRNDASQPHTSALAATTTCTTTTTLALSPHRLHPRRLHLCRLHPHPPHPRRRTNPQHSISNQFNQGRTRDAPKKSNWAREPCSRFCIARREGGRESMQGGSDQMGHARICTYTCTCRRQAGGTGPADGLALEPSRIHSVQICVLSKHTATHSQRSSQSGWAVWRHTAWLSHRA